MFFANVVEQLFSPRPEPKYRLWHTYEIPSMSTSRYTCFLCVLKRRWRKGGWVYDGDILSIRDGKVLSVTQGRNLQEDLLKNCFYV